MRQQFAAIAVALVVTCAAVHAQDALPPLKEYVPKGGGAGHVVVLVSGQTGPGNYGELAEGLAAQGFDVALVDGNDFWGRDIPGARLLLGIVEKAMSSPHASPGKVGVVGASLGGATALTYATKMPQHVAAVVAQYPLTSFIKDPADFVGKMKVPVLMMAGTFDNYKGCCMIEMARNLAGAAKERGVALELVEYPGVDHGFSTDHGKRRDIAADSLKRTVEFLRQQMP